MVVSHQCAADSLLKAASVWVEGLQSPSNLCGLPAQYLPTCFDQTMHPSSYTVTVHIAHADIADALQRAGSRVSVEDVLRELSDQDTLDVSSALDRAIAHLNMHPEETGPARLFHLRSHAEGTYVDWVDGGDDLGPFPNDDEAVQAGIDAGGKHDEERERYEPVPALEKWHPAREDEPLEAEV